MLAQVLLVQLFIKRLVGSLWHNAFLFKDGENAHLGADQINGRLQIGAKGHGLPHNALLSVLLLLQHEHEVVEELLETLVGEVDADLLEAVVLEGLEASDVQFLDVQRLVGDVDEPVEGAREGGLGQRLH